MKESKEKQAKSSFHAFLQFVKELFKNPKGRALLFFGFYLIFFIFLGISFRTSSPSNQIESHSSQQEQQQNYSLVNLEAGNYHFIYHEIVNGIEKNFEGKAYHQMKEVTNESNEMYFLYSGISLERQDDVWKVCENPFYYRQIMEENILKETLQNATFISKTVYQDQTTLYRYEISTVTLWNLYQQEEIDIADSPNIIEVSVSDKGDITKIYYDYSPYNTYLKGIPSTAIFEVIYQDYGKIEAFDVPA